MNDEGNHTPCFVLRPTGMPVCARHSTPALIVGINSYQMDDHSVVSRSVWLKSESSVGTSKLSGPELQVQ